MNKENEITSYLENEQVSTFISNADAILESAKKHLTIDIDLEVSVEIVDQDTIRTINKEYRQKDMVTDVLSFPMYESYEDIKSSIMKPVSIGDIFICFDRASEQAIEYSHQLDRELAFLYCHGLLHLFGFDHMCESDAKEMEGLQEVILNDVNIKR